MGTGPTSNSESLLACIRSALGFGFPDRLHDWPAILETASGQGVLPLVPNCRALRQNAARVLIMTEELGRVLNLCRSAGLPALAIKGPVLAHTLYADPACRVFSDLDLLIPPDRREDAIRLLSGEGYQAIKCPPVRVITQLTIRNRTRGIDLDLHWALTPPDWFVSAPPNLWERARTVRIGDLAVPTPGEEDTFLHLCFHGSKHGWTSLNWLVDLCSLALRSPGLAERALALSGSQTALAAMVRFGVAAAQALIPETGTGIGIPARTRNLAARLVRQRLSGASPHETALTRLSFQWRLHKDFPAISRFVYSRIAWRLGSTA